MMYSEKEAKPMNRYTVLAFLLMFLFFPVPHVSTLQPPFSEEELVAESDLIVEGKVLGVVRVNERVEGDWKHETYRAWLFVTGVKKGNREAPTTVEVSWNERDWAGKGTSPVGGPYEINYRPGEFVRAYLKYSENRSAYMTVHWNGKMELEQEKFLVPSKVSINLDASTK